VVDAGADTQATGKRFYTLIGKNEFESVEAKREVRVVLCPKES
jgi:hypothetical protein